MSGRLAGGLVERKPSEPAGDGEGEVEGVDDDSDYEGDYDPYLGAFRGFARSLKVAGIVAAAYLA